MRKVAKNLYLPVDVAEQLEEHDNESRFVTELLREEFDDE
jgi:hypothetical protein